jgi:hypothetical protein
MVSGFSRERMASCLNPILREGKQHADFFAKFSCRQIKDSIIYQEPPPGWEMSSLLGTRF